MNCLKCSNYWQTEVNETQCEKCGKGKTIADVIPIMPPLIVDKKGSK